MSSHAYFHYLQFTLSDRLPDKVCGECIERLFDANAIRETCIASEKVLKKQLGDVEVLEDNIKVENYVEDVDEDEDIEFMIETDVKEEMAVDDVIEAGEVFSDTEEMVLEAIIEEPKLDLQNQRYTEVRVQQDDRIGGKKVYQKCCLCKVSLQCSIEDFLQEHMIPQHSDVRILNSPRHRDSGPHCRMCWQTFPTAYDRDTHVSGKAVRKRQVVEYECADCNAKFTSEMEFYKHQETLHGVAFECEFCKKPIPSAKQYYTHIHAVHKAGTFVCELCGKSFNRKYMLEDHKNIHNGIRPFMCTICGSSFSRKNVLRSHYRSHTGEKPYQCEYCDKAFSFATDLKRHVVAHTGKHLYECENCGKGFNRKKPAVEHAAACETTIPIIIEEHKSSSKKLLKIEH